MVGIVAGQGLGLFNTSLGLLGSQGVLGSAGQGRSGEKVYVNASNGNLVVQQQDEWLVGVGPDAGILRTYNSQGGGTDDNGDNWRLGLSRRVIWNAGVINEAGSSVKRVGEDGAEVIYTWDAGRSQYLNKDGGGSFDTLSFANNEWTWVDGSTQTKETYEVTTAAKDARLVRVEDPDGNQIKLNYAVGANTGLIQEISTWSAQTASGEKIAITYDNTNSNHNSDILSVTTTYLKDGLVQPDFKRVSYTYEDYTSGNVTKRRLKTVTVDLTPTVSTDNGDTNKIYKTTYSYVDGSTRVSKIEQHDGNRLDFEYVLINGSWRVALIYEVVAGEFFPRRTSFNYDVVGTTKIMDALGQVTVLTYDTSTYSATNGKAGQLLSVKAPAIAGVAQSTVFSYQTNGNLNQIKDAKGNYSNYFYDDNGNLICETQPQGGVIRRTFDAITNALLTETRYTATDPDTGEELASSALTTRYVYDNKTHLRFVISAEGLVTEYRYNGLGQREVALQYSADKYDLSGLSADTALTLTQLTSWGGKPLPAPSSWLRTDYTYNTRGQIDKIKTFNAVDVNGAGVIDGKESTTQYIYDQAGNLLQTINGRAKSVFYEYDGLNRITRYTDADGTTTTTYQDVARKTVVQMSNGLVSTSTYDETGALTSVSRADGNKALGETTYRYDRLERLVTKTLPGGEKTHYLYDAAGRQVGEIDAEGVLTEFAYNNTNQVVLRTVHDRKVSAAMLAQLATDPSSLGLPANLLANAPTGWAFSSSNSAILYASGSTNAEFINQDYSVGSLAGQLSGDWAKGVKQQGAGVTATTTLTSAAIPVSATLSYEVSAYTGAVNAKVTVEVAFYNGTSEVSRLLIGANDKEQSGGAYLSDFKRVTGLVVVPAGATSMRVLATKGATAAGSTESNMQLTHTVVARAEAGQILRSAADLRPMGASGNKNAREWSIYDKDGRLVRTIKATGNTTSVSGAVVAYNYDAAGRLTDKIEYATFLPSTAMTAISGSKRELQAGEGTIIADNTVTLSVPTDPENDRRTRYFYDADGRQVAQLDADNYLSRNQYDAAGRLAVSTRYARAMVGTLPEGNSLPTVIGAGAVKPTDTAYVERSNADTNEGGADQVTQYMYNNRGQLTAVIDPLLYVVAYEYDPAGNKSTETRYANSATNTAGAGRILLGKSFTGTTTYYALTGNAKTQVTTYEYDDKNRLKRTVAQPTGLETTYSYHPQSGDLLKVVTAVGIAAEERTIERRYDTQGRVTEELSAEGSKALVGKVGAAADAVWVTYGTKHVYDNISGHRIATIEPQGNLGSRPKTIYYYDKVGRLTHRINALGEVVEYTYDSFGNLIEERHDGLKLNSASLSTLPGGLLTEVAKAALLTVRSPSQDNVTTNTYNRAGQLISTGWTGYDSLYTPTKHEYNAFGERERTIATGDSLWLGGTTEYVRSRRGQIVLQKDTDASEQLMRTNSARYDAFGRVYQTIDGNGNAINRQFDKRGREIYVSNAYAHDNGAGVEYFSKATSYDVFDHVVSQTDQLGLQTTYTYDSANRTSTVKTPEGIITTTQRDHLGQVVKVTDPLEHYTTYDYNRDGQLTHTKRYSATGELITQSSTDYDGAGRIASGTDALGVITKISYDAANRVLSRLVDEGGLNLKTSYVYDAQGRVMGTEDANGIWTRTEYDRNNQVTAIVVDPTISPGDGTAKANALNLRTEFTYDAAGHQVVVREGVVVDSNTGATTIAKQTDYYYDELGRRIIETVDADYLGEGSLNLVTRYAYDDNDNVVSRTDAKGQVTRYTYNAANQLSFTIEADGSVTRREYDPTGLLNRTTAYAQRISTAGLGLQLSDANVVALISNADAGNQVSYWIYDSDGRLQYTMDPMGQVTLHEYDKAGNVTQLTRHATQISEGFLGIWEYEGTVSVGVANAIPTTANDRVEKTVYDAANRPVFSIDALNGVTGRTFDGNGRVTKTTRYANPPEVLGATRSSLPADEVAIMGTGLIAGDLTVKVNDAKDQTSHSVYDKAGRQTYAVDAEKYVTAYTYDGAGRLKTSTRYNNALTSYTAGSVPAVVVDTANDAKTTRDYDAAGRLTDVTDAELVTQHTAYDEAGRIEDVTEASNVSGQSVTTHYTYDKAGRLTAEIRAHGTADESTTEYVLDEVGQRVKVIDPRGVELATGNSAWAENERNRLIEDINAPDPGSTAYNLLLAQYTTTQEFDHAGRVTKTTDPLGGVIRTEYDAFGNAVKVTDPNENVGYFYFDKRNQATWQVDPERYAIFTKYNNFGEVEEITRYDAKVDGEPTIGTPPKVGSAGGAGIYVPRNDQKDATTKIEHDKLGRQTQITDAEGFSEFMDYDLLGNKTSFTNKLGGQYIYTHDKLGRVLTEKAPEKVKELSADGQVKLNNGQPTWKDVITNFEYDSRGNARLKTEAFMLQEQRQTQYTYDRLDRLKTTTTEAVEVYSADTGLLESKAATETRWYDARGNTLEVRAPDGGRRLYHWDALNRKSSEISPMGAVTHWDYAVNGKVVAERKYDMLLGNVASLQRGGDRITPADVDHARETQYVYDSRQRLVEVIMPSALIGEVDAFGNYSTSSDVLRAKRFYDSAGNLIKEIDARGKVALHFYNKAGYELLKVDAGGAVVSWTRDGNGRVLTQTAYAKLLPNHTSISAAASIDDLIILVSSAEAQSVSYEYDRMGRISKEIVKDVANTEVSQADGSLTERRGDAVTEFWYERDGQIRKRQSATEETVSWTYDQQGQMIAEFGPQFASHLDGSSLIQTITKHSYNALGLIRQTDLMGAQGASDRTTGRYFNKRGELIKEVDANGVEHHTRYDINGRTSLTRLERTDANGVMRTSLTDYRYDLAGRQTETRYFDLNAGTVLPQASDSPIQTKATVYNAFDQALSNFVDGQETGFADYDNLGRVFRTIAPDGVPKIYIYDANGNITLTITPDANARDGSLTGVNEIFQKGASQDNERLTAILQTNAHASVAIFDARNQQTDTYELASRQLLANKGEIVVQTTGVPEESRVQTAATQLIQKPSIGLPARANFSYEITHEMHWTKVGGDNNKRMLYIDYHVKVHVDQTSLPGTMLEVLFSVSGGRAPSPGKGGGYMLPLQQSREMADDGASGYRTFTFRQIPSQGWELDYGLISGVEISLTVNKVTGDPTDPANKVVVFQAKTSVGEAGLAVEMPPDSGIFGYLLATNRVDGQNHYYNWGQAVSADGVGTSDFTSVYLYNVPPEVSKIVILTKSGVEAGSWGINEQHILDVTSHSLLKIPAGILSSEFMLFGVLEDGSTLALLRATANITTATFQAIFGVNITLHKAEAVNELPIGDGAPPVWVGEKYYVPAGVFGGLSDYQSGVEYKLTVSDGFAGGGAASVLGVYTNGFFSFDCQNLNIDLASGIGYTYTISAHPSGAAFEDPWEVLFVGQLNDRSLYHANFSPNRVTFRNINSNAVTVRLGYKTSADALMTTVLLNKLDSTTYYWDAGDNLPNWNSAKIFDFNVEALDINGDVIQQSQSREVVGTKSAGYGTYIASANSQSNDVMRVTGETLTFMNTDDPDGRFISGVDLFRGVYLKVGYRLAGRTDLPYTFLDASLPYFEHGVPPEEGARASLNLAGVIPPGSDGIDLDLFYQWEVDPAEPAGPGYNPTLPPGRIPWEPSRWNTPTANAPILIKMSRGQNQGAGSGASGLTLFDTTNSGQTSHRKQYFDAFGRVILELDALGVDRAAALASKLNRELTFDELSTFGTALEYNKAGNLVRKITAEVSSTAESGFQARLREDTNYGYDLAGRLVSETNANEVVTSYLLRETGDDSRFVSRKFVTADGGGETLRYDAFGDLRSKTIESGVIDAEYSYQYDGLGRLTRVDQPQGSGGVRATHLYQYDALGNRISHTTSPDVAANSVNSFGAARTYVDKTFYDVLGRVVQTTSAVGLNIHVQYASGNLVIETDELGKFNRKQLDKYGRLSILTDKGGAETNYTYNLAGNLVQQQRGSSSTISFQYNQDGTIREINDSGINSASLYEYDKNGNRVFEGYGNYDSRVIYQSSTIRYDELNRVVAITDKEYNLNYEYDLVGNRRRVLATKASNGIVQDFWYKYDKLDRMVLSMGALSADGRALTDDGSDRIEWGRTDDAVALAYDVAGRRVSAKYSSNGSIDHYEYTADGYLTNTRKDSSTGDVIAQRQNDLLGRVTNYSQMLDDGWQNTSYTYDADNKTLTTDSQSADGSTTSVVNDYTDVQLSSTGLESASLQSSSTTSVKRADDGELQTTNYRTKYIYEYREIALQKAIKIGDLQSNMVEASWGRWADGISQFSYDTNGNIKAVVDVADSGQGVQRDIIYATNSAGQVLSRSETGATGTPEVRSYYYFDNQLVGEAGNSKVASRMNYTEALAEASIKDSKDRYRNIGPIKADFDSNFQAINAAYPMMTPGSYMVRQDDTLPSIARAVWGDASLWYLIADANSIVNSDALDSGQVLVIPNKVTNIHNNSATSRVYNPGEAMGDTSPTIPDAPMPPPPPPVDEGCGALGALLMTVVAAVVAAVTQQWWLLKLGSEYLAFAAAAATGSIVSQGVGLATGIISEFSWKSVAISAISAGVGKGMEQFGLNEILKFDSSMLTDFARGAAASTITQGVAVAVGLQEKFDWRNVAASGAGSVAGGLIGEKMGPSFGTELGLGLKAAEVLQKTVVGVASGLTRSYVNGQRPDFVAIAADSFGSSFGSALGDAVVGKIVDVERERAQAKWDAEVAYYLEGTDDPSLAPRSDNILSGQRGSSSITAAQERVLKAGLGPRTAENSQALTDLVDYQVANTDLRSYLTPKANDIDFDAALSGGFAGVSSITDGDLSGVKRMAGDFSERAGNWMTGGGFKTDAEVKGLQDLIGTGKELFGQRFVTELVRNGEMPGGPGDLLIGLVGGGSSGKLAREGIEDSKLLIERGLLGVERQAGPLKEFEVGSYRELQALRRTFGSEVSMDLDHIPSKAALRIAREDDLGRQLTKTELRQLEHEGVAVAMPRAMHQDSRTYAGRNNSLKIEDAANLHVAIKKDLGVFISNATKAGVPEYQIMKTVSQALLVSRQKGLIK